MTHMTVTEALAEIKTIGKRLAWRKEGAPVETALVTGISTRLKAIRGQAAQRQGRIFTELTPEAPAMADWTLHVSESEVAQSDETFADVLGTLDGALSKSNATTVIMIED